MRRVAMILLGSAGGSTGRRPGQQTLNDRVNFCPGRRHWPRA